MKRRDYLKIFDETLSISWRLKSDPGVQELEFRP